MDLPATKIGAAGTAFRANLTAPLRSSSSAERSREAECFASTYRKLNRSARSPAPEAASAVRRTNGFFMSFERP